MCESGIFSRGYLKIFQDTNLIYRVTGKDRVLTAKPQGLLLPLSMADRGARAVQIAGGQGCLGFDQGAESKEGIEGVSKTCSPRAEIDGVGQNRRGANDRRRLQLDLHRRHSSEHQDTRMADRWASR
jgi:hypothetical protein